jgi:putative Holliday junction resolvase
MIVELSALRNLPRDKRLLGVDLGTKTIGLALSDVTRTVATPFETLRRTKLTEDAGKIAAIVAKHEVGGLVVGLPVNMDGSEGPMAQRARQFARDMAERLGLPVALWDERLTTAAVERGMIAADFSRKKRAALIDSAAAAYMLQGALDRLRAAGA